MKRFTLIIVLVILISLAIATPVLAKGKGCENAGVGVMWGFHVQAEKFGNPGLHGRFYGTGMGITNACK